MKRGDDLVDFMAKVRVGANGCWEWTASKFPTGYGRFNRASAATQLAHRWSWILHRGPIPAGKQIDHLCRNRGCVNPDHLEPVSQRINQLRGEGAGGRNARKTHCPQGHEYTPDNTYRNKRGWRHCRTCTLEQQKIARAS